MSKRRSKGMAWCLTFPFCAAWGCGGNYVPEAASTASRQAVKAGPQVEAIQPVRAATAGGNPAERGNPPACQGFRICEPLKY